MKKFVAILLIIFVIFITFYSTPKTLPINENHKPAISAEEFVFGVPDNLQKASDEEVETIIKYLDKIKK